MWSFHFASPTIVAPFLYLLDALAPVCPGFSVSLDPLEPGLLAAPADQMT
jgi:hypothetical protein